MKDKKVFLHIDLAAAEILEKNNGTSAVAALDWYEKTVNRLIAKKNARVYAHSENLFSMTFDSTEEAFSFILEAGELILSEKWPGFGSLPLKIAAHYGEGELVNESYSGPGPARSFSLLKFAGAGNIFITKALYVEVKISSGRNKVKEIGLVKLGDNFSEEVVCQVLFFDFHKEASSFTKIARQDTNFVPQRLNFTGREEELSNILMVLRDPAKKIVAITGPVGYGKTRLALQAALELRVDCVDGVYHVDLSYVKEIELVPILVAEALRSETDSDFHSYRPEDRLLTLINVRKMVLVLDGIDDIGNLNLITDKLIVECPNLKIILTSVTDKKIPNSTVFKLDYLKFPGEDEVFHLRMTSSYPAVEFVLQAAFASDTSIDKGENGLKGILNVCRKLQGNPYAIELFIANDKNVEPQSFPAEIAKAGGTVNSVIKYVCEQSLSREEKEFIALISVCNPSFNTVDARDLCKLAGFEISDVVRLCEMLYEKGLLFRMTVPDGAVRFYLNRHIRAYVESSNGEKLKVYRPVYEEYLNSLAAKYYAEKDGKNKIKNNGMMVRRIGNFRQLLSTIIADKKVAEYPSLILSLVVCWRNNYSIYEGVYWLTKIFKETDFAKSGYIRRYLLVLHAWFFTVCNKKEEFYKLIKLAEKEALESSDYDNLVRANSQIGWRYCFDKNFEKALEEFGKNAEFIDKIKDPLLLADIYADFAKVHFSLDNRIKYMEYLEKELETLKKNNLRYSRQYITTLAEMENYYLLSDTPEKARSLAIDEKALAMELGDKIGLAKAARSLGNIENIGKNSVKALEYYMDSLSLFREAGNIAGTGSIMLALHNCNYVQGKYSEALDQLLEATKIFYEINDWTYLGRSFYFAGRVYQKLGFNKKAAYLLGAYTSFSKNKSIGNSIWESKVPDINSILKEIRLKLDQTEFAAAWMDGYNSKPENVLEEAVKRR